MSLQISKHCMRLDDSACETPWTWATYWSYLLTKLWDVSKNKLAAYIFRQERTVRLGIVHFMSDLSLINKSIQLSHSIQHLHECKFNNWQRISIMQLSEWVGESYQQRDFLKVGAAPSVLWLFSLFSYKKEWEFEILCM